MLLVGVAEDRDILKERDLKDSVVGWRVGSTRCGVLRKGECRRKWVVGVNRAFVSVVNDGEDTNTGMGGAS